MKRPIIIQDGLTLSYGRLEPVSEKIGEKVETERFNVFQERLPPLVRDIVQVNTILRMGDGIKTFESQNEIDAFLVKLFLEYLTPIKIYNINQIHTKVF